MGLKNGKLITLQIMKVPIFLPFSIIAQLTSGSFSSLDISLNGIEITRFVRLVSYSTETFVKKS